MRYSCCRYLEVGYELVVCPCDLINVNEPIIGHYINELGQNTITSQYIHTRMLILLND